MKDQTTKNSRQLLLLILAFMAFVPIGTLTHEMGHLLAARQFGFETKLHYASCSYYRTEESQDTHRAKLIITAAGPLQTILFGTFGLILLLLIKKKGQTGSIIYWLSVFLSLFWLREPFNLLNGYISTLLNSKHYLYGGDELKLSKMLEIPDYVVPVFAGIIGALICLWVVLRLIPRSLRLEFIISGFLGGGIGYWMWMDVLGPVLLS